MKILNVNAAFAGMPAVKTKSGSKMRWTSKCQYTPPDRRAVKREEGLACQYNFIKTHIPEPEQLAVKSDGHCK